MRVLAWEILPKLRMTLLLAGVLPGSLRGTRATCWTFSLRGRSRVLAVDLSWHSLDGQPLSRWSAFESPERPVVEGVQRGQVRLDGVDQHALLDPAGHPLDAVVAGGMDQ